MKSLVTLGVVKPIKFWLSIDQGLFFLFLSTSIMSEYPLLPFLSNLKQPLMVYYSLLASIWFRFHFSCSFSIFLPWKDIQDNPMIEIISVLFLFCFSCCVFGNCCICFWRLLGFNPGKGRDGDRRGLASMLLACTYTGYNLKPILDWLINWVFEFACQWIIVFPCVLNTDSHTPKYNHSIINNHVQPSPPFPSICHPLHPASSSSSTPSSFCFPSHH